jgi:hypothetical protein
MLMWPQIRLGGAPVGAGPAFVRCCRPQDSWKAKPMSAEYFIPFRRSDVVSMCADELTPGDRGPFLDLARLLTTVVHLRFHAHIEALKDAYQPFHPGDDTRTVTRLSHQERQAARRRVEEELTALARAANFTIIDSTEVERAFVDHSLLKVRMSVDTDVLERVMFFRRGEEFQTHQVPAWLGLRRRPVSCATYARVLVYATFKDADHFAGVDLERLPFTPGSTIVKLFQNVPRNDLEMIFPNVQVRMRGRDKAMIGISALLSGIVVVVTKLFTSLVLLLLLLAFWTGLRHQPVTLSQTGLVSAGVGLVAFGAYLVRQVTKFKNRKIRFMKALSDSLYFRNLDNDAGVFHHLLDLAEEEEVIEALLAFHFLHRARRPLTAAELDRRIEEWFARQWDTPVDFEVDDGLRKLREFSLLTEDENGYLSVPTIDEARQRLEQVSDALVRGSDPRLAVGVG